MLHAVLIHLGSALPSYFWDTVCQARRFYGGGLSVIVPDDSARLPEAKRFDCQSIPVSAFTGCEKIKRLNAVSFMPRYADGNFWHAAMQRLFVLEEFMRRQAIDKCVHFENDVTLYHDPSLHEPLFTSLFKGGVAVTPLGPTHGCTAAYLYADTADSLGAVTGEMLGLLLLGEKHLLAMTGAPMVNEMTLLSLIQAKNPQFVKSLPVMPKNPVSSPWLPRRSKGVFRPFARLLDAVCPRIRRELPPWGVCANVDLFKSLFDAASWGQYVGGTFQGGPAGAAFPHHWAGPDLLKRRYEIVWHVDENDRRCPYVKSRFGDEREWKLNNLHIHSKRIRDFV